MDKITLTGLVATTPRHLITHEGLPITSFRLATSEDDGPTNWYTVSTYRTLAINTAKSISKGQRVIVTGERTGTSVEVEATSIGHDLNFGVANFERKSILRDGTLVPA